MSKASDKKWFEEQRASALRADKEEQKRNKKIIDNWNKKYPNYVPKKNTNAKNNVAKQLADTDISKTKQVSINASSKTKQVNIQNKTKATSNAKTHRRTAGAGELSNVMNTNSKNAKTYSQIRSGNNRIGNATKGTAKNVGSSFMNTFATLNADASTSSVKRRDLKGGYAQNKERNLGGKNRSFTSETQRKQEAKSYEKRVDTLRKQQQVGREPILKKASELKASGDVDIEKAKEGLGEVGKFGINLYSQILQWTGDAAVGAATGTGPLIPMFFRSFGDSAMTAREAGASRNKQIAVGALSGGVEVATEKLTSPFTLMKQTAGKGILDNLVERASYNLTRKLVKQGTSKNLAYKIVKGAVKAGTGMASEGMEEVVSGLFQPAIESIYDKNALEQYKHPVESGYLKQLGSDFVMGSAMAGVLGGGSAVMNSTKGSSMTNFTKSETEQLIKAGKAQGESSEAYSFASQLEQQRANGEEILNEQANDLASKIYQEQYNTEKAMVEQADIAEKEYVQNLQATAGVTDSIKNDRRISGEIEGVMVDQVVAKRVSAKSADIEALMVESGESAATAKVVAEPIARIVLGTATPQDLNVAAVGNDHARAIIEAETGVTLPYTNKGTIDELSVYSAGMKAMQKESVITEARQEARTMASEMLTTNLDAQTAAIFNKGMENIDFSSIPDYVAGFNLYYQGGTVNYDYGKILKTYDNVIPEAVKMAAYNAGNQIYIAEQAKAKESQKKVVKSKRRIGNLTMSEKNEKQFGKEKSAALNTFVQVTGKNVVIVDQIDVGTQKDVANGKYQDGTIYISAKSSNPIFDVLKHELTHNLQETAPESYNELKQFVFKKFYESDQKKYDAKIRGMIDRYARNGVDLTVSQAEDELLADATDVFFKNEDMIQSLVNENRSLAEKLVDGIRALLDTLHRMASGNKKGDWLEALGIVEEAEALWTKALNESIGVNIYTEVPNETNTTRYKLKQYTEKQKENWKSSKNIIVYDNDTQMMSYIDEAIAGHDLNKKMYIGIVPENLAKDVLKATGINIKNRNITIGAHEIRKILKDHGGTDEALRGQRIITKNDFLEISRIIESPDEIRLSDTDYFGRPVLEFVKNFNGKTIIIAYDSRKHGDLRIQTMFSTNKKGSLAAATGNQVSVNTSKTTSGTASNNSISNSATKSNISKGKFSLKDNEGNTLSDNQAEYFKESKVRDDEGNLKVMYHGTSRADRVGNYFDPERATSGPMAFFTDKKDIADNYSKDKQDTSINYDNEYNSYETQFRINHNGNDMSIVELWGKLSNAEREEIKTKAKEIAFDDDIENIITIPGNNIGNGSYDLRYAKGNALQALVDSWLNSGDLIHEESRFMEVLELAGVEGVYYNDPDLRDEKVYETYLNIVNPISTTDIDQSFIDDLKSWLESTDLSMYEDESANSDMWDKRNRDPLEWVENLERDVEKGTTHAWTSIPDAITAYLKDRGYDGIIDQGGKNGGDIHTVVIPFYSEQIKSVTNENPTTDTDIRYQLKGSEIKKFDINKTQVLANMKAVTEMESVCDLDGSGFNNIDDRKLSDTIMKSYDSNPFTVHNHTLGDVNVTKRGVKSSTQHKPLYGTKIEGFKAIKHVIRYGEVINVKGEYAGKSYDRVIVAAPIRIGENEYYMGVVINRNAKDNLQNYYLHDVVLAKRNSPAVKDSVTTSGLRVDRTVSPYSILQQLNNINSLTEKDIVSEEGRFQLKEDNDNLQQKVSELEKTNKKLKAEFKRSKYVEPEPKQAGIAVSRLIEAYLGKRNGILHESVMQDVNQVFAEMRKREGNWNLIDDLCLNAADKITDKMEILHDELWTEYTELRDTLRKTTLRLSENYWNDIDDFNELRKSYFGSVKLSKTTGVQIDTFYQELAETHPGLFDAQEYTNEVDQLYNILEVVESIKPYVEEYSEGEIAEFRDTIAKDVLQMSYDLAQKKTFADLKHEEKMKAVDKVKAERNALMKKQKDRMKSRLDKKDAFYKNKINDIKQQNKDKKEKKYYTSRIEAYTQWMSESLLRPTETKHIPHGYAKAIATMLSGFDFSTTRTDNWTRKYGPSRRTMKLAELRNEYEKLAKNEDSMIEIDESMQDVLNILSAELDGKRFDELSIDELEQVYRLIKQVRFSLSTMNKTFSDGLKENISEYGDTIIADNATMKAKKQYEGFRSEINRFFNETNVNPIDMFETVGGKMFELYQNMRRGFDQHIDNVSQGKDFIAELAKKYKVKKWIDDNARAKKFTLEHGGTIELVPSQVMSLYCLMNREQAVDHILGSGITASPIGVVDKTRQKLTKSFAKRRLSDAQVMPTIDDVKRIIGSLTAEQKKVADELQSFMGTTCSEWGNETSMKLYGYKKFTEKHYFPIKSSEAFLDESFDKVQASKIKNVGFTKNTVMKANNPIVVDDIFNVFTQHVNTMSMYNSLVPALTDFERVYNYKQRNSDGKISATVQKSIQQSFGDNVNNYIRRFVNDVNQNHARNNDTNLSNKLLANYKKAKIGANLRVLVQQPTAIVRAATVINPAYLMTPGKISLKEMQEHCQIARWKSWGFYNTDVSRSMRDIFIGKRNIVDTLFMEMYGKADDITWATIWSGVKKEINSKRKDLKPGTDAYWKAVNERFSYVVDRTQVVDSVFHRSQIMRSQDLASKMITSFMAEPTKTFNMMRTELVLAGKDFRNGNKKSAAGRVARVTSVYIANAVAVSMAAALIDALRARGGDDEDKDYLERWQNYILENFKDNANPANLLPLLRDVSSMAQGYEVSRMDMDGIADLVNSVKMWSSDKYTLFEKTKLMAEAISSVTGIPLGNVARDTEAAAKQIAKCFVSKEYIGYLSTKYRYDITDKDNRPKFMAYYIKAMKNGDTDIAKMIEGDMKANGVDSEYMRGRITSAFSDEFAAAIKSNDADRIETEANKLIDAGIDRESIEKKVKTALGSACNDALEKEDLGTAYEVISTMEEYGLDYDYIVRKKRDLAVNEIASYVRIGRMDRAYADAYSYHDEYNWEVNSLIERAKKIAYGN